LSSACAQERQSHIDSIEIMVSDCSHCGMSPLGQIHVKVCGDGARGCCVTPNLDHPFQNDWEAGRSYEFDGGDLDECNDFDLGDPAGINLDFFMEIYHTGTDSGKFDWMKVRTREGDLMQCKFYEQLDNQSEEIGRECTIV